MTTRGPVGPRRRGAVRRRCRAVERDERGETLIELLITIAIMGIGLAAVIGAVLAAVDASSLHRNQVTAINDLRTAAELVTRAAPSDCSGPGQVASVVTLPPRVSVTAVQYWNGSAFVGACGHHGLQRITLQVSVPSDLTPGFTQTLDVVVRNP